ncbi:iron dependent repressor, metal binding and dimerization domain protein [Desulfosporosinus sp. PR]|uniref:iron dependent repressor, metal binding and dimerization domain protein n=1 Tax=Candidatus Desulfosporosinus nitrosoreducens TaxID=3401928 RepID=UPI0027E73318|nr:iron dependent repressor, metal binding and dimerization domain protein [Desulfosporosinus sp. PR]MDQ7091988.1 iron dependent repressor, metal binding and dimerization domain protein [Desulfosporosinus sp. PR]
MKIQESAENYLKIATQVYERHQILSHLLMALGVSEETALKDACRIEHEHQQRELSTFKRIF